MCADRGLTGISFVEIEGSRHRFPPPAHPCAAIQTPNKDNNTAKKNGIATDGALVLLFEVSGVAVWIWPLLLAQWRGSNPFRVSTFLLFQAHLVHRPFRHHSTVTHHLPLFVAFLSAHRDIPSSRRTGDVCGRPLFYFRRNNTFHAHENDTRNASC